MKKVVVIILMSLGFIGCLPADEKIIECEPIVLEGMYYHYDSNSGEVTYMKNQVNYLFADGEVTVRDANFLILKGTYHIQDGVLTVTSNIKNIVYEPYDVIEIKISISPLMVFKSMFLECFFTFILPLIRSRLSNPT